MSKFVISCIQRRFLATDWDEAAQILSTRCEESLLFPHDSLWVVKDDDVRRWRITTQTHLINMSEGNLDLLRQYAIQFEHASQNNPAEIWQSYGRWRNGSDKLCGISTTDYNNSLTLVRADIDTVGQAFAHKAIAWRKNVLGQEVVVEDEFLLLFQIRGNNWTQILQHAPDYKSVLRKNWQRAISRRLSSRVIEYGRSDTASVVDYTLYDSGKRLETMTSLTEKWDVGDAFLSPRSDLTIYDLDDVSPFLLSDQLFTEEGAYEPGIQINDLLDSAQSGAWQEDITMTRKWCKRVCKPEAEEWDKVRERIDRIDYIKLT